MFDAFPDLDGLEDIHADADFDNIPDYNDGSFDFDQDGMNDFSDGSLDVDGNGFVDHADPMHADYVQSLSMPDPFSGPEPTTDPWHADADFDGFADPVDGSFDFDQDGMNDTADPVMDVDHNGLVDHADPMAAGYVDSMSTAAAGSSMPDAASMADQMTVPDASAALAANAGMQGGVA